MKSNHLSRRQFLGRAAAAGLGVLALGGGAWSCNRDVNAQIPGSLLGPDVENGHRLRYRRSEAVITRSISRDIVIIGGGVAGLACAWKLQQLGCHDFLLLEMEAECGGNARGGIQNGLRHPWGAHYLPVPDASNTELVQFLHQLGVITGFDAANRPIFNELYLCHAPQERLLIHGIWQKGLVPHLGVPAGEQAEIQRFFAEVEEWKVRKGADGRPAFTIPAEGSSQDPEIVGLDRLTMEAYLQQNRFSSPHLRWYIDYCCRDDFGLGIEECSAWAGLHYFAARTGGGANAESGSVLTWPEGNGWLTARLRERLSPQQVMQRKMVFAVENTHTGVQALAFDLDRAVPPELGIAGLLNREGEVERMHNLGADAGENLHVQARAAVFAGPQFVAAHVVRGREGAASGLTYAPWIVANLRVKLRDNPVLADVHWDNVAYGRSSLGYVFAGHQGLGSQTPEEGMLTWYEPLSGINPAMARKQSLEKDYAHWQAYIMQDFEYMHPGLVADVRQLDVWRWGHGMVRPVPGLITGAQLAQARAPQGRIFFAHSDLSGISIFEEAFHRGVIAAEQAFASLNE